MCVPMSMWSLITVSGHIGPSTSPTSTAERQACCITCLTLSPGSGMPQEERLHVSLRALLNSSPNEQSIIVNNQLKKKKKNQAYIWNLFSQKRPEARTRNIFGPRTAQNDAPLAKAPKCIFSCIKASYTKSWEMHKFSKLALGIIDMVWLQNLWNIQIIFRWTFSWAKSSEARPSALSSVLTSGGGHRLFQMTQPPLQLCPTQRILHGEKRQQNFRTALISPWKAPLIFLTRTSSSDSAERVLGRGMYFLKKTFVGHLSPLFVENFSH